MFTVLIIYTAVFLFGRVRVFRLSLFPCIGLKIICTHFLHIVLSTPHIHGIQSFLPPQEQWCPYPTNTLQSIRYTNPDYNYHPCYKYRTPHLLYLHLQEVEFAQRMLFSLLLGGIIGFERRASERPAGIRTMCMVCLGSCFFSMTSQLAFRSSTMGWDAARVVSLFHLSI